jgi:sugar lactone lactonase YvrE
VVQGALVSGIEGKMRIKSLNETGLKIQKKLIMLVFAVILLADALTAAIGDITTTAGTGSGGYDGDGIPATSAMIDNPYNIAIDSAGNYYFSDYLNNRVRKVDTSGIISTIAGTGTAGYNGDGISATAAELNQPIGICLDAGDNVFIGDFSNHRVRRVDAVTGIITTVAGTGTAGYNGDSITAVTAELYYPRGVFIDCQGLLYISDRSNYRVRVVDLSGEIYTIAGNGTLGYGGDGGLAVNTSLGWTEGVWVDHDDNVYLVISSGGYRVCRVDAISGIITTIAGTGTQAYSGDGGPGISASLDYPLDVHGSCDNEFFITTSYDGRVRKVDAAGNITTVAGTGTWGYNGDGIPAVTAQLHYPSCAAPDYSGDLYICDNNNNRIRKIQGITCMDVCGTLTPAGTYSPTFTISQTPTITATMTITATFTISGTISPTATATQSFTPTQSETPTFTVTPTVTQTQCTGEGSGSITVPTGIIYSGSTGNTFVFNYINGPTAWEASPGYGTLMITIPSNWPVPSMNPSDPGYFSVTVSGGTLVSSSVSGNYIIVEVSGLAANTGQITVTYGDKSEGGPGLTAPIAPSCPYGLGTIFPAGSSPDSSTTCPVSLPWIVFVSCATTTSTPTQTLSAMSTITQTMTETPTLTTTYTLTPTVSLTATLTPAHMPTATPTITPTPTPYPIGDIIVYPNPYSPGRAVDGALKIINLPTGSNIVVYTISGELVISISAQTPVVYWNGRNAYNSPISPGVYYYVIKSGSDILRAGTIFVVH